MPTKSNMMSAVAVEFCQADELPSDRFGKFGNGYEWTSGGVSGSLLGTIRHSSARGVRKRPQNSPKQPKKCQSRDVNFSLATNGPQEAFPEISLAPPDTAR